MKKKVLFFSEPVTLAHMARPMVLARCLDEAGFDIHFASDHRYQHLFPGYNFKFYPIQSISSQQFMEALAVGAPVYEAETLISYVTQDLEIIEQVKPDIIVGDFRLSLAISSKISGIQYVTISNAYWSPYVQTHFPIAEHPMVKMLGVKVAQQCFNLLRPMLFSYHCMPLNKTFKHFGLKPLGNDLKKIYTQADYVAYSDIPDLYEIENLPENHFFLGPIIWSPTVTEPAWWKDIPSGRPIVYFTLGSSGANELFPKLIDALAGLPITVMAANPKTRKTEVISDRVFITDFLPGDKACSIADLVICNGGSPTSQQALKYGVPVIGIANNMDQHLNMNVIKSYGAGELLRSGTINMLLFQALVRGMLNDKRYKNKAVELSSIFRKFNPDEIFVDFLNRL